MVEQKVFIKVDKKEELIMNKYNNLFASKENFEENMMINIYHFIILLMFVCK